MNVLSINIEKAGYGDLEVLTNVHFEVKSGDIVAIIGPNGSGKSTLLKAIMKMLPVMTGKVKFKTHDLETWNTERIVEGGISFAPQGNRVFDELTVRENLEVGGYLLKSSSQVSKRMKELLMIFPRLKERIASDAGTLSGGEKQQLALARALMLHPKVLLLDEPSLGLAPNKIDESFGLIKSIQKEYDTTLLIVEQKVQKVFTIANKVIAMRGGKKYDEGTPDELQTGDRLKKIFLL